MAETSNVIPPATGSGKPPEPPETSVLETSAFDPPTPPIHPGGKLVSLVCAALLGAVTYLWWSDDVFYELLTIFLCTVFLQGALRRYYKYRLEVQQLIQGRLEKLKDEVVASKDPATAIKLVETLVVNVGKLETSVGNLKTSVGNLETGFGGRLDLIERLLRPLR